MSVPPLWTSGSVQLIDTEMGGYAGITASYLIAAERPCLVETGTALSAPVVIEALRRAGLEADDLATIVVTHIHLDHAGGVGDVAAAFPAATVVVHEAGARHLVDPSRLLASAARVYGPDLDLLFGPMRPVAAERLQLIGAEGSVDLGAGRELQARHAPGHASHHLGLLDSATGELYVGDAAGIWIPEVEVLRPATPPPDFDLEQALTSLEAFGDWRPTRLLYSHYGPAGPEVLERAREELLAWVADVRAVHATPGGLDLDHAAARVLESARERYAPLLADPAVAARFEHLSPVASNIAGVLRWLDRQERHSG